MPQMTIFIIAGALGLGALIYLIWWWVRFQAGKKAHSLAASVASESDLSAVQLDDALEYGRLLPAASAEYSAFCLGLVRRRVADPRTQQHLLRLFKAQRVSKENAPAAFHLAGLILQKAAGPVSTADMGNVVGLLDQLEIAAPSDKILKMRANLALQWVDVSPLSIKACMAVRNLPDFARANRFLFDFYSAAWDVPDPSQQADPGFNSNALAIFQQMAEISPANPSIRERAIQAAFACGDNLACFEQCARTRDEFGAPALGEAVWRMWALSIVRLEGGNWPAYARREFKSLPDDTPWLRLQEIFDRAAPLLPEDKEVQAARVWTYLGGKIPVKRALGVYESALQLRIPILPALQNLTRTYFQEREWAKLEIAGRYLLTFEPEPEARQTRRWLVEALLEGRLKPDLALFEQVFDEDQAYPALNEYLAQIYIDQTKLVQSDLTRLEQLFRSPLPASFTPKKLQTLREKYAITCLEKGFFPETLRGLVVAYLQDGGSSTELRRWAADQQVGEGSLQLGVLEKLIEQRPPERKHILALAEMYAVNPPNSGQMASLAEAAVLMWADRPIFDPADCRTALLIRTKVALVPSVLHKLIQGLLTHRPESWRSSSISVLAESIQRKEADEALLVLCVERLFGIEDPAPEHVAALELLLRLRDEPIQDGLRLLHLYDAGRVKAGDAGKAPALAEDLARNLAERVPQLPTVQRPGLFEPLFKRQQAAGAANQPQWAIDLLKFGVEAGLLPTNGAAQKFIDELANVLLKSGRLEAVAFFRWLYDQSGRSPADAAVLFQAADALKSLNIRDAYWLRIARQAVKNTTSREAAERFIVTMLIQTDKWDKDLIEAAVDLIDGSHRQELAQVFIHRAPYGRDHHLDHRKMDVLDENPALASGDAIQLMALADKREKKHNSEGALEVLYLVEDSVGGSEDLARRILTLMPSSSSRAAQAGRVDEYLNRYRNSYDLLAQMVALARDPSRPLRFETAYTIVDRWGDLALKQPAGTAYATDASFIAITKCEVYDLYQGQISQEEANQLLRSIARQSRQALSSEARQRIERIGDAVLFSSGQAAETRQTVAEILNNLGNLAGAVWHFERLYEMEEYRQNAAESLERIARKLESPRRELPALLAAYRCVAQFAQRNGQMELAESTARKAKAILVDEATLEELTGEDQRRVTEQQDELLRIYQSILEGRLEKGDELVVEQRRDLADVLRLRGLWHQAGKYYSELALALQKKNDRAGSLEAAEQVFDCYYKAGKSWWDPAAKYLLKILWGRETVPPKEMVERFGKREMELLESIAVLYHSLFVDPALRLDLAKRATYKRSANQLYDCFPFQYLQDHEYIQRLQYDLSQVQPTIQEPFELVPHISRHGRTETWTGLRYEKIDRLGSGEFADVYKVREVQTGTFYAMKLINAAKGRDKKAVERFEREGRWLRELDHPNIVKCHDIGVQEDRQYIIMDLVEGSTLDKLITARRLEIPIQTRLEIFLKVCAAVEYLHSQGLLHRDLHPNNVLVGGTGFSEVKLTDFGLATIMDREGVGKSSRIHGRENYTSPEVYEGRGETAASDIFSLGALLCFILTGYPRPDAALQRELKSKTYFNLGDVIERALANLPQNRYQRVTELISEIRKRVEVPFDFGAIIQNVTPARFQQLFQLKGELGRGQSGVVYLAQDLRSADLPEVAIKEIESQQVRGSLERRVEHFFRVRDLDHPNIVHLQGFFKVDKKLYIVMERVIGPSLAGWMEQHDQQGIRFKPAEVLKLGCDLSSALACIHAENIVHGCVLPTNVLIIAETGMARLSDFTSSVLFDREHWHKSALLRQFDYYLAPEVRGDGAISPASDVYSLGCMMAHLATSQRGILTENELYSAMEETRQWTDGQMDGLVKLVLDSTALDPGRRVIHNGAEFQAALQMIK